MKARWIIPVVMAVTGFVVGYLAPRGAIHSSEEQNSRQTRQPAPPDQPEHSGAAEEPSVTPAERKASLTTGLRAAVSQLSNAHRAFDLGEFFKGVSREEMADLADGIMELPDGTRWLATQALMARWVELDVNAAAGYVGGARTDRLNLESALTTALALRDPEAAIRWTQQLPASRRDHEQRSLVNTLSWRFRDDPAKGVALLLQAGMLSADRFRGGDLFTAWAKSDPRTALACVAGVENTKLRRGLMNNALKGWAESDPAAAAAWCRQLPDAASRNEAIGAVAIGMVGNDLDQGLTLARSLPEGRARDHALALISDALFWTRRDSAIGILAGIPFESGNEALKQLYTNWSANDPGAAVASLCERLDRLPAGTEERLTVEKYLERSQDFFGTSGSDAVAKALAHGMSSVGEEARARTLDKAAAKWAAQNLVEARTWAEALPEGAAREHALAGIARGWTGGSITEAAGWLDALPVSLSRDAAVGSFARTVLARDPAGALAWMRTIPDPNRRLATLQTAWVDWMNRSPAQAAHWRDHSPDLSAAERSKLLPP